MTWADILPVIAKILAVGWIPALWWANWEGRYKSER